MGHCDAVASFFGKAAGSRDEIEEVLLSKDGIDAGLATSPSRLAPWEAYSSQRERRKDL